MGQDAAHPAAALAVSCPLKRALHDGAGRADARLHALARAGVERLPVFRNQSWLVIEQVALTRSAVHEKLDDPFRSRPVIKDRRGRHVSTKKRCQRDTAQPTAERAQKITAILGHVHFSITIEKFVAVDDDLAGVREAMPPRVGCKASQFLGAGVALQQQAKCPSDCALCLFSLYSTRAAMCSHCRITKALFKSAYAWNTVVDWPRTGVSEPPSGASSASMNGSGTVRNMKR